MAININNVLASAQKLMLDQNYWNKLDQAASANSGYKVKSMESKMFEDTTPVERLQIQQAPVQQMGGGSKMPKSILESFQKMPAQTGDIVVDGQYNGVIPESFLSGLGTIGMPKNNPNKEKPMPNMQYNPNKQQLTEAAYQKQIQQQQMMAQQPMQASGPIDYNYIKYIVAESIKEYFSNNNVLNESRMAGLKIGNGNKIQFVDTKGNLYEGVLTLKKKKQ